VQVEGQPILLTDLVPLDPKAKLFVLSEFVPPPDVPIHTHSGIIAYRPASGTTHSNGVFVAGGFFIYSEHQTNHLTLGEYLLSVCVVDLRIPPVPPAAFHLNTQVLMEL
jgi:hypothetical protein